MDDGEGLAQRFEAHRAHLRAVAFRLLGSTTEADDAVQETWLRVSRAGADGVENLGGMTHDRGFAGVPEYAGGTTITP